jgi:uncharacterized protein involved in exopolysaccharide biosynthesis
MANEPKEPAQNQQQPAVPPSGYPPPWANYPPEDEIDLREYWKLMVENRKLIGLVTGACTLVALIVSLLITPIYRAEVLLAPAADEKTSGLSALAGQFGDIASLVGINLGGGNSVDESIATLKSRELGDVFIEKENLKPILFANRWDSEGKRWRKPWWNLWGDSAEPTDWDAYDTFNERIRSVETDTKNSLVTLSVEWKDPELAAKWANDLVRLVNEVRRKEAIGEADKSIKYLQEQVAKTGSVEVQQSIYKLIEAQSKKRMLASTRDEYSFKVIDPAVPPQEFEKPKRLVIVSVGLLLGFATGVIVSILRRRKLSSE